MKLLQERIMKHQDEEEDDQSSRVLYEICSMINHTLNFPLPFSFSTQRRYSSSSYSSSAASSSSAMPVPSKRQPWWTTLYTLPQDSPTAFASLFLGISLAFMLFGSVIFLVGLLMLPWVVLLVLVFYVAAFVSNLSLLGRFVVASFEVALAQGCST